MDKNTLLAVVLSAAIMIGWYAIFPPPEPPPRELQKNEDSELNSQNTSSIRTKSSDINFGEYKENSAKALTSIVNVDPTLISKEVTIETDNYKLVIETRGGVGKSLQLKKFKHTKPRITLSTWFPILTSFIGPDFKVFSNLCK